MGKTTTKKMRGSNTHGWGMKKKHRGKGSRGGVGFSGSKGHKMQKILKYFPDHFDHTKLKKKKTLNSINISGLAAILEKEKKKEVNLSQMGIDKLLGDGEANFKAKITVSKWSKSAGEKLKAAGCELVEA
jgi:large subunit ribosomal protein L15